MGDGGSQYNSEYDDDNELRPAQKLPRAKPPPPPSRKTKASQLPPSDTSALDGTGDVESGDQHRQKLEGLTLDVEDDDEHDHDDYRHDDLHDSDSDSTSIPEKVKRITMLQQKVAQLESILQEYRKKEKSSHHGSETGADYAAVMTPSASEYPMLSPNTLEDTLSAPPNDSEIKKTNGSKGNIV